MRNSRIIDLTDLLTTGSWRGVRRGTARAEVLRALGEPTQSSMPTTRGHVLVLRFGNIEVGFDDEDHVAYVAYFVLDRSVTMTRDELLARTGDAPFSLAENEVRFAGATAYFQGERLEKIISSA